MNLLCPQCQQNISISDEHAGQLMKCPLCARTFSAPQLAKEATVSPVPSNTPPHSFTSSSSAPAPTNTATLDSKPVPAFSEYTRKCTVWISPRVVPWIGPASLFLAFVLTFFNWLWVHGEQSPVAIGRNIWQLGFLYPINALSILYLIALVIGLALGITTTILPRLSIAIPNVIQQIMPWRSAILLTVAAMGFVFLALQLALGFAQEKSMEEILPVYSLRTKWLRMATLLHAIAVSGYALECWLTIRKTKPLPRIDLHW